MKKIVFFVVFGLLFSIFANIALAGGGQVTGEKGRGEVNQNQVNCESPWLCPDNE